MNDVDFKVPYSIGTYLVKEEDNRKHVDQVHEYIIGKDGISTILMLDVLENPRLSNKISIEDLLKNWIEIVCSPEEIINEEFIRRMNASIAEILKEIPSVGDKYEYLGYLPDNYDIVLESFGCTVERYDFGVEQTVISRIKLLNNFEENSQSIGLVKKNKN